MIPPILGPKSHDPSKPRTWEPCCLVHSRRTRYCAEWDFVNDTTQEYARMDLLHIAPPTPRWNGGEAGPSPKNLIAAAMQTHTVPVPSVSPDKEEGNE
jgi:hypothetical protein